MKLLTITSTLPVSNSDKVPAFVRDQAITLKRQFPDIEIHLLAPHSKTSTQKGYEKNQEYYTEYRFHYFIPRYESLIGTGILPSIKQNYFRAFQLPFLLLLETINLFFLSKKIKPDLIYAHWFTPQAIAAWLVSKILRIPFGFTTHSSDMQVLKHIPLGLLLAKRICKDSAFITIVSEQTYKKTEALFRARDWLKFSNKITILPMGVGFKELGIDDQNMLMNYGYKKFNLSPESSHIFFIGRLVEIKGVHTLLKAMFELRNKKTVLIIAGEGQDKQKFIDLANKLKLNDRVKFVGFVDSKDKDSLFALSDLVCIPSIIDSAGHTEGLPVVFMEALASRKIVIASDVSGAQHVINSGADGFLYPHASFTELATAIDKALELTKAQKKDVQEAAYSTAKQFEWSYINREFVKLLKKGWSRS